MSLFLLAYQSLIARRLAVTLTIFAVSSSLALVIVVETVRDGARHSFLNTISSTDLIMGARTGGVQLLLYSVFHLGNATNNVSWKSYQDIAGLDEIDWIVPISLGDSHRGYRVVGTTPDFFTRYKYGRQTDLNFAEGRAFSKLFDVVIGATIAKELEYSIGSSLIVAHGLESFVEHRDFPFEVSGILGLTGTPVDRSLLISLEALQAIHTTNIASLKNTSSEDIKGAALFQDVDLTPSSFTAALIGVDAKLGIFGLQRTINQYSSEPLTAILPGVALAELYQITGVAETALRVILWAIVAATLLGVSAMLVATLSAREREFAVLRTIGATPIHIVSLIISEALLLSAISALLGLFIANVAIFTTAPFLETQYGLSMSGSNLALSGSPILLIFLALAPLSCVVPAMSAYRSSLTSQLTLKY